MLTRRVHTGQGPSIHPDEASGHSGRTGWGPSAACTIRSPRVAPLLHRRVSKGARNLPANPGVGPTLTRTSTTAAPSCRQKRESTEVGRVPLSNSEQLRPTQIPHLRRSREGGNPSPTGCATMTPEAVRHAPTTQSGGESRPAGRVARNRTPVLFCPHGTDSGSSPLPRGRRASDRGARDNLGPIYAAVFRLG